MLFLTYSRAAILLKFLFMHYSRAALRLKFLFIEYSIVAIRLRFLLEFPFKEYSRGYTLWIILQQQKKKWYNWTMGIKLKLLFHVLLKTLFLWTIPKLYYSSTQNKINYIPWACLILKNKIYFSCINKLQHVVICRY